MTFLAIKLNLEIFNIVCSSLRTNVTKIIRLENKLTIYLSYKKRTSKYHLLLTFVANHNNISNYNIYANSLL